MKSNESLDQREYNDTMDNQDDGFDSGDSSDSDGGAGSDDEKVDLSKFNWGNKAKAPTIHDVYRPPVAVNSSAAAATAAVASPLAPLAPPAMVERRTMLRGGPPVPQPPPPSQPVVTVPQVRDIRDIRAEPQSIRVMDEDFVEEMTMRDMHDMHSKSVASYSMSHQSYKHISLEEQVVQTGEPVRARPQVSVANRSTSKKHVVAPKEESKSSTGTPSTPIYRIASNIAARAMFFLQMPPPEGFKTKEEQEREKEREKRASEQRERERRAAEQLKETEELVSRLEQEEEDICISMDMLTLGPSSDNNNNSDTNREDSSKKPLPSPSSSSVRVDSALAVSATTVVPSNKNSSSGGGGGSMADRDNIVKRGPLSIRVQSLFNPQQGVRWIKKDKMRVALFEIGDKIQFDVSRITNGYRGKLDVMIFLTNMPNRTMLEFDNVVDNTVFTPLEQDNHLIATLDTSHLEQAQRLIALTVFIRMYQGDKPRRAMTNRLILLVPKGTLHRINYI